MRLGKRQQARRIPPSPVQEATPPPREPMVSFATGPYDLPPPGFGPEGPPPGPYDLPPPGFGPEGPPPGPYDLPPPGFGPDVPQTMGVWPDGPVWMGPGAGDVAGAGAGHERAPATHPVDDRAWMGGGVGPFPAMAYAYAPDGTPLVYGTDGVAPGPVLDGPPEMHHVPGTGGSHGNGDPAMAHPSGPAAPQAVQSAGPWIEPAAPQAVQPAETPIEPAGPQVTWEPEAPVPGVVDDALPWPDFAPIDRTVEEGHAQGAGVERLPTATQAFRLRPERPVGTTSSARPSEGRLARLHLRGGMLGLAQASLEQLAGAGAVDREVLADLAEARWRSGEFEGAADAAEAHLLARGDEPIARIIAAERAARDGRILDARQLATQVQGQVGDGLERLFAGEPRSAVWPAPVPGWMDAGALVGGRFGLLVGGAEVADPDADTWLNIPLTVSDDPRIPPVASALLHTSHDAAPFRTEAHDVEEAGREVDRELQAAERDLTRGDLVALSDRLGLLLRREPTLAPVILSITEHALTVGIEQASGTHAPGEDLGPDHMTGDPVASEPGDTPVTVPGVGSLHMLRGDILRSLGRDAEATRAYQEALRALPGRAITREST